MGAREQEGVVFSFFFLFVFGLRRTFAALKFMYIFLLHANESEQIYITVLLWVVETVSLRVMACDCLLHYFQWDSVFAILGDSIPLKVIV